MESRRRDTGACRRSRLADCEEPKRAAAAEDGGGAVPKAATRQASGVERVTAHLRTVGLARATLAFTNRTSEASAVEGDGGWTPRPRRAGAGGEDRGEVRRPRKRPRLRRPRSSAVRR